MEPGVLLPAYVAQGCVEPGGTKAGQQGQPQAPPVLFGLCSHKDGAEASVEAARCPFPGNQVPPSISSGSADTDL